MMVAVDRVKVAAKVLVVDDDPSTLHGFKQLLEHAKYDVIAASTFSDARFALSQQSPDLLIADIRLGEYNGLQLLVTSSRSIPTIIVTGYPDPVLEAEARRLGADYLLKPVSAASLMAAVRAKLAADRPGGSAFAPGRRWPRKAVTQTVPTHVEERDARLLDISYGGLRLELEHRAEEPVPTSFTVVFPNAGLSVPVDVVWTTRAGDEHWLCGGRVGEAVQNLPAWHELVDAVG